MDLLSVPMKDRARLLAEVSEDDRSHFFATSKCPITKEVDDMMEEVGEVRSVTFSLLPQLSRVACDESFTKFWKEGKYVCAQCQRDLYPSSTKFDGPCAWPSFRAPGSDLGLRLLDVVQ